MHDTLILCLGFILGLGFCLFNRRMIQEDKTERIIELEVRLEDMTTSRNYWRGLTWGPVPLSANPNSNPHTKQKPNNPYGP